MIESLLRTFSPSRARNARAAGICARVPGFGDLVYNLRCDAMYGEERDLVAVSPTAQMRAFFDAHSRLMTFVWVEKGTPMAELAVDVDTLAPTFTAIHRPREADRLLHAFGRHLHVFARRDHQRRTPSARSTPAPAAPKTGHLALAAHSPHAQTKPTRAALRVVVDNT